MRVSVLMPWCKSFMKRTKSIGPKMDPWGTSDRTGFAGDLTPSNTLTNLKFNFKSLEIRN